MDIKIKNNYMTNKFKIHRLMRKTAGLFLSVFCIPILLLAQIHKIPLPPGGGGSVTFEYKFKFNQNIAGGTAEIGVQNGPSQVTWNWGIGGVPGGQDPSGKFFIYQGIKVELPALPDASVSSALNIIISGSPNSNLPFTFKVEVSDPSDATGATVTIGTFNVFITKPVDVALVLDRSGSMSGLTPSGTRWNALKQATKNFMTQYQLLKPDDRTSVTYFSTTSPLPNSICCNGLLKNLENDMKAKINTELGQAQFQPGGATAMGQGIKFATTTQLNEPANSRNILLVTDGEQNRDPQVDLDGKTYIGTGGGGQIPNGIRICAIGIGSPSGKFHTILSKMAETSGGTYYVTDDGTDFNFKAGQNVGDMHTGFTAIFVKMLEGGSPQIIQITNHNIPSNNTPVALQNFPLNKNVNKLLLEFVVGKNFEGPQILQLLAKIKIQKDGASVLNYAKPSFTGFTNTLLLMIDFKSPPPGLPPLTSAGNWAISIADSIQKFGVCKLTSIADDHRLVMTREFTNKAPKVNDAFPINYTLTLLGKPITDATVEAIVLRPGEDLGDLLAKNPKIVNVSQDPDASSPGVQKYNDLLSTDSNFRNALNRSQNIVALTHGTNGKYSGTFNGLNVSGIYHVIYHITGNNAEMGGYERFMVESFYTSFSNVDLSKSAITTSIVGGNLVMNIRPFTSYGRFIGPAMGNAFRVSNPGIQVANVVDHQDGRYTITFSGNVSDTTRLVLLDQVIYTGKLEDASKGSGGGIIDWIKSLGIPVWLFWLLVILFILFILWLLFRKK